MAPLTHLIRHLKWHLNWCSRFCTAHGRQSLYFTMGCPFPLKIAPLRGDLNPHLIHGSLSLPKSISQMASRSVEPFLDSSRSWQTDHDTPSVTKSCIYVALRCGLIILTTTLLITMCLFNYIMSSLKHTNIHTVKQSAFKQLLTRHLFQSKLVTMHCDYLLTCTLNVLHTCLLSCT